MPQGDGERRGVRPTDLVSLGALTTLVPRSVLDEAIAVTEAHEVRVRKLPAHVIVYLLMALCQAPGFVETSSMRPDASGHSGRVLR
ncbi:transposase domain-containing protein [Streptomyces sp. KMM 9044]|uniref:transposase domain-containing protein n=1 Tax=Streptomyces sp. KMM 9044 TaxID=2744474 RepID=UPI0021746906